MIPTDFLKNEAFKHVTERLVLDFTTRHDQRILIIHVVIAKKSNQPQSLAADPLYGTCTVPRRGRRAAVPRRGILAGVCPLLHLRIA